MSVRIGFVLVHWVFFSHIAFGGNTIRNIEQPIHLDRQSDILLAADPFEGESLEIGSLEMESPKNESKKMQFFRRSIKELKAGFSPQLSHFRERILITAALAAVISAGIYVEKNLNDTRYFAKTISVFGAWPMIASILNHARLFKNRLKLQEWHPSVFFYLVGGSVPLMAHSLLHTILITELFDFHLTDALFEVAEKSPLFDILGLTHLELEAGHVHHHHFHDHAGRTFLNAGWLPEGSIRESAMVAAIASHDLVWINYRGAIRAIAEGKVGQLAFMGHAHDHCGNEHDGCGELNH